MMNLERQEAKQAVAMMRALRWVKMGQLPLDVFDSQAVTEELARKAQVAHNTAVVIEESKASGKGRY